MLQTKDKGFIICGSSSSGNISAYGSDDFWIVKLDTAGNMQWNKAYGSTMSDYGSAICVSADGGYLLVGTVGSATGDAVSSNFHGAADFWVVKIDSVGNLQWQKALGGSNLDVALAAEATVDGGYILAGYTTSQDGDVSSNHGNQDCWIVKLDNNGVIVWEHVYGGSNDDIARAIKQTSDKGYVFCGKSYSGDGDVTGHHGASTGFVYSDYWVVKVDSAGALQWQRSLGGFADDEAFSIEQTADMGYVVSGCARSANGDVAGSHGKGDSWLVKLDKNANTQWGKAFGGSEEESANSIKQTADHGYFFAGCTSSGNGDVSGFHGTPAHYDVWVTKTDSLGAIQWQKCVGGTLGDVAYACQLPDGGGYVLSCSSQSQDFDAFGSTSQGFDYWIVKLDAEIPLGLAEFSHDAYSLYPNPTSGLISVSLPENAGLVRITNALGQEINPKIKPAGSNTGIDMSVFENGIYFIWIATADGIITRKIILNK